MDSVLFKSKLFGKKSANNSRLKQSHKPTDIIRTISNQDDLSKYVLGLTKLRPNLDAKFISSAGTLSNLHKIRLDIQPYEYQETQKTKKILDTVTNCKAMKWLEKHAKNQAVIDVIDGFARGVSNIINSKYQQQFKVSNAYVKLWEIYETFNWLIPKRAHPQQQVNFFHMAEAPGQWINTTNHYFHQHMPRQAKYNWFANTLNPQHPRMKGIIKALPDTYGFIKQNPKKWIYSEDGSGDITIPDNIAWFNQFLLGEIPGNLDVITGDAGTNPIDVDLELLQRIDIAQAIVVACTARKGSNCVIKHFLPFMSLKPESVLADGFFMSFMYLYHLLFSEFHMFKPLSSSPGSGEFYAVARGFHGITPEQRKLLLDYLGQFSMNKPMFAKSDIPPAFADKVSQFINNLQRVNILNKSATCLIIECFANSPNPKVTTQKSGKPHSHKKSGKKPATTNHKIDCVFFTDPKQFTAQKNKDLEQYLDKYHIARIDKLKLAAKKHTIKYHNKKQLHKTHKLHVLKHK